MRKVLYGGLRSTDTATETVLQRAFIPQDAHSWGKEYTSVAVDGYDIQDYTPLAQPAGTGTRRHLFANTTPSGGAVQVHANPAINGVAVAAVSRVGRSTGRPSLELGEHRAPGRGDRSRHGHRCVRRRNPRQCHADRLRRARAGLRERARTIRSRRIADRTARTQSPSGLLQDYGENDTMLFGLLTGSYGKPHDGGVLRKAVASLQRRNRPRIRGNSTS